MSPENLHKVICVVCPVGCEVEVRRRKRGSGGEWVTAGERCVRGTRYAIEEVVTPKRVLTTTLPVEGGSSPVVPVRTARPIPKDMLMPAMRLAARLRLTAPVEAGRVVVEDVLGSGVGIVTTDSVERRREPAGHA